MKYFLSQLSRSDVKTREHFQQFVEVCYELLECGLFGIGLGYVWDGAAVVNAFLFKNFVWHVFGLKKEVNELSNN